MLKKLVVAICVFRLRLRQPHSASARAQPGTGKRAAPRGCFTYIKMEAAT